MQRGNVQPGHGGGGLAPCRQASATHHGLPPDERRAVVGSSRAAWGGRRRGRSDLQLMVEWLGLVTPRSRASSGGRLGLRLRAAWAWACLSLGLGLGLRAAWGGRCSCAAAAGPFGGPLIAGQRPALLLPLPLLGRSASVIGVGGARTLQDSKRPGLPATRRRGAYRGAGRRQHDAEVLCVAGRGRGCTA